MHTLTNVCFTGYRHWHVVNTCRILCAVSRKTAQQTSLSKHMSSWYGAGLNMKHQPAGERHSIHPHFWENHEHFLFFKQVLYYPEFIIQLQRNCRKLTALLVYTYFTSLSFTSCRNIRPSTNLWGHQRKLPKCFYISSSDMFISQLFILLVSFLLINGSLL